MHWIIAQLMTWAAVRHHICVIAAAYFHHHALGSFTCVWNHLPGTSKWTGTMSVRLHR